MSIAVDGTSHGYTDFSSHQTKRWMDALVVHILFEQYFSLISYLSYQLHCCALPDKRCLSHGMLPLSGHDDVALLE